MRQLNGVYAQAFNRRHGRVGHLFQGRYKAVLVERESHLLELCRYLVLNPVRAGLCAKPEEWPWSSYRASAGFAPVPLFLSTGWVLSQFAETGGEAAVRYRTFVRDGLGRDPFSGLQAQVLLGGEEFVSRHREELEARGRLRPAPSEPERPPLAAILSAEGEVGVVRAYREHGYRLHEIAAELGVHESTVSRRLRRLEQSSSG
jgi:hypothetical protein